MALCGRFVGPIHQPKQHTDMTSSNPSPAATLPIAPTPALRGTLDAWLPKSLVCVREGYGREFFLSDLVAGATCGVVALPLAMAFAVNSGPGITPQMGLYTAIIAGFLVSVLGGSRVAIAGPTGAFMPILYTIAQRQGIEGLAVATVMAGVILIIMGLAKLGSMI
jgi:SulP family sulfate permease